MKLTEELNRLVNNFGEQLANHSHQVLGSSTINIGKIKGGTRANIVPDKASAEIDIRTVPSFVENQSGIVQLRDFLTQAEITNAMEFPPMDLKSDHPWIDRLKTIHPDLILTGAPWFSDSLDLPRSGIHRSSPHRRRIHQNPRPRKRR